MNSIHRPRFCSTHGAAFCIAIVALVALLPVAFAQAPVRSAETLKATRIAAMKAILEDAVATLGIPEDMGGISILVRTPAGNFFASSLPDATPSHHFRAASVTKTTTAAAIMLLEQRGLLRLDDPVTAPIPWLGTPYLPDTPEYDVPHKSSITIRQLLQHRAGVFDLGNDPVPADAKAPCAGQPYIEWKISENPAHSFTIDELVGVVAKLGLSYGPPPAPYHYTNTGYSMLGKIIERVSGRSLDAFLYEEFTRPLGLEQTYFVVSGEDRMPREPYLKGYSSAQGEVAETTEDNSSYAHAEGNMVTTLSDLATWIRALMRGEAGVSLENAARMREVVPLREGSASGYGLGIGDTPKALGFGHDGGIMGYLTVARHDPETDYTTAMVVTHLKFDDLYGLQTATYRAALAIRELFR
jgi:D-alanyl-D-alanine carboxypeptidase